MKSNILGSAIVITLAAVLSSCLKSSEDTTPIVPQTFISIMHLAATAPPVDVYFDDKKVSNSAFPFGAVSPIYNSIDKGTFSIKFKKANTDSLVSQLPVADYDSMKYYTIFIYHPQANGPANAFRIRDDFTEVLANQSKPHYRFFHGSSNTGPVDFYINGVKIESGRTNADNTQLEVLNKFLATNVGFQNVEVKLAGTDTSIAVLNGVEMLAGNAYTFYLKGVTGGTGLNQLSIGLLRASD